ncbi:MAG: thiamine phosphate synthase [Proteobacteria bacterium]|nr:thiamine phosphate synthase [Pseudomonadota bacterium]
MARRCSQARRSDAVDFDVFLPGIDEVIGQRALLIVNGNADVAWGVQADGLHLPADAAFARPDGITLVGRSVHSVEAALQAEREGADYVIAGPIYETPSHPGVAPAGVRLVSAVVAAVSVPPSPFKQVTPRVMSLEGAKPPISISSRPRGQPVGGQIVHTGQQGKLRGHGLEPGDLAPEAGQILLVALVGALQLLVLLLQALHRVAAVP